MILLQILKITMSFDQTWQSALFILGGLGIFIYGIHLMGSSLKQLAGDKLKLIIQKSTSTPIMGMLIGFIVTMLTQSSSTTSAIAVGLVAAGLMTFKQSIGVLLGANIGGTVLPLLMAAMPSSFKPILAVVLVFLGAVLIFFFKRAKIRQAGAVILGFGLIFLGLVVIDFGFDAILVAYTDNIESLFSSLSSMPEVAMLVGVLFTMVVQSSAATIGIVQNIYEIGTISLQGSLALMLGANIGTTITAIIAAVGSSKSAKKVALANTLIKTFGVLIFIIIFRFAYYPLTELINNAIFGETKNALIISFSHVGFNIINSLLILLLIKPFVKVCNKIIPDDEKTIEDLLLDYSLIKKSPQLALSFAKTAIDHMANKVLDYVHLASKYSFNQEDSKVLEIGAEYEREINCLDKRIHDYLIKLTIANLDDKSSILLSKYLDEIKDLERVGDHCTNILEFFTDRHEKDMHLSDDGIQDLELMYSTVGQMTENTIKAIIEWSPKLAMDTIPLEDEVDKLEETLHERHIHRVNSGVCSFTNTEHYVEILSNLERIGDHLTNILDGIAVKEYCKDDEYNH